MALTTSDPDSDLLVERMVTLLDGSGQPEGAPQPLRYLGTDARSVVLLGDPGMGKTTALQGVASQLPKTVFKRVRTFVPGSPVTVSPGGLLLLDALDEATAAGAQDPLAAVAARLLELGKPKFWLSCRAVDWVGQGGATELADCAPSGLVVARLLALTDQQIIELAGSRGLVGSELLAAMDKARLVPLLRNPWTLNLVFEVARDGLPESRFELFERAAILLTRERNDRPRDRRIVASEVLDAAGGIFAALLISGVNAVNAGESRRSEIAVSEFSLVAPSLTLDTALRSRLFASVGEDSWEPQHRTMAEFLAARFLADRVTNHGLSLRRVLALLQGGMPLPHPSLRGLFAWLATLLPSDRASSMVAIDPYGVVSYGDPTRLSPTSRRSLLAGLGQLAAREPWFRMHTWGEANLAALATPDLTGEIREILVERPIRSHLFSCVCDALAEAAPLQQLAPDLVALLADPRVPVNVRTLGIEAFFKVNTNTPEAGDELFRRLVLDQVLDPNAAISGQILLRLYPGRLNATDLVNFLDRWAEGDGSDGLQVSHRLPLLIPFGFEPELLDLLAKRPWATREGSSLDHRLHEAQQLVGIIAARAVQTLPVTDAAQMPAWFDLFTTYPIRKMTEFSAALTARTDLHPFLVLKTSENFGLEEVTQAPWNIFGRLRRILMQWNWSADTAYQLLAAARSEEDPSKAACLFAAALGAHLDLSQPGNEWFEEAWSFGQSRNELRPILIAMCSPSKPEPVLQEHKKQQLHYKTDQTNIKASQIRNLIERQRAISKGVDKPALAWLAERWFDTALSDEDLRELRPHARLSSLFPSSIVISAEQGFRELALTGLITTPAELAKQAISNSWPASDYAILAGADLLFADASEGLPIMSSDRSVALLCLALTRSQALATDSEKLARRRWQRSIASAFPQESADAIYCMIMPQLAAGAGDVAELRALCDDESFGSVRPLAIPRLFRKARLGSSFWQLALSALRELSQDEVYQIAVDHMVDLVDAEQSERWPWLHLAWRLTPEQHEEDLKSVLVANPDWHGDFAEQTGDTLAGRNAIPIPLSFLHRKLILRVLGPLYGPPTISIGVVRGISPAFQLGRVVQVQIDRLSSMPDESARHLLEHVVDDPVFAAHREHALQSLAAWSREHHARSWKPPSVSMVLKSLRSGSPASASDLMAFAEDHLHDLNATLHTTEDNLWRSFWNTDHHGHVDAKIENFCRDQLTTFLRARFDQACLGLSTEVRQMGDDRCDIVVDALDLRLPIEVKCDYNDKLWTAWRDQLADRYAREPRSAGRGIYLVFWFGPDRGASRRVPQAQDGQKPNTADEMHRKLEAIIKQSDATIRLVVLDVSPLKPKKISKGSSRSELVSQTPDDERFQASASPL